MGNLFKATFQSFDDLVHRASSRNIRIAVTGLSKSGKTTFITSFINHLLNADPESLPLFYAVAENRYLDARIDDIPKSGLSRFDYYSFIDGLTSNPPHWPESTTKIRGVRIQIGFESKSAFFEKYKVRRLDVDIIDYPGEWLLDFPLIHQSYSEWSDSVIAKTQSEPFKSLAYPWLDCLRDVDLTQSADQKTITKCKALYREYLVRCKEEHGFNNLQPGRFLIPDDLEGRPELEFFPCILDKDTVYDKRSAKAVLEERYNAYKQIAIKPLLDQLSKVDRQVILVDVLGALAAGHHVYDDVREAVSNVIAVFNYGKSNLLAKMFKSKIDKVLLLATKADHVTMSQHANLKQLLSNMILKNSELRFTGSDIDYQVISSIRSTSELTTLHDNMKLSVLKGKLKGDNKITGRYPGEVPPSVPRRDNWPENGYFFREYCPDESLTNCSQNEAIPHINIDEAINYLLEDKLQ